MSHAELKLALELQTAKLNDLLLVANDLLIPVALVPNNTKPQSDNDVPVTQKLLSIVYSAKI